MSDFFYKETLGPVFSPVINVKREKMSQTVVSAIDNLLSPCGNMFTRAETVKKLMSIEKLSLEETAKALSLRLPDVANKLRLLEFSPKERSALVEYDFSEEDALQLLRLDKISRLYAIEYCRKNSFDTERIREYVDLTIESQSTGKEKKRKGTKAIRKFVVNDIGFFFNSIENVLRLARETGLEVQNSTCENEAAYDIHISVKKTDKAQQEVDKTGESEYNI